MVFNYQFSADATAGSNAGKRGIEILTHLFKGFSPAQPNITGHYFNEPESGWGQTYESYISDNIAQQFIVSYLYDAAGEPRWVLSSFNDTLNTGLANTYEVHCPGCAWLDIGPTFKNAGTQSRNFPAGFGTVLINTQFSLQAPLSGPWNRSNFTLQALSVRQ
jgi:lysyl endopeptidase